jgi:hypothetical protein
MPARVGGATITNRIKMARDEKYRAICDEIAA